MKSFVLIAIVAQAVLLQTVYGQYIKSCGCGTNIALPTIPAVSSPVISGPCGCPGSVVVPNVIQSVPNVIQAVPNVIQTVPNVIQAVPNVIQAVPPCSNVISSYPVLQSNVAGSLADTLSLLTVSSLLADKLPYNQCCQSLVPVAAPISAPILGGCGCSGYGGIYF